MGYHAPASGLLTGNGLRRFKARRRVIRGGSLRHFPDVHLSQTCDVKRIVPPFDPALEFEYTPRELILLAEKMLLEDLSDGPYWLNASQLRHRSKHEIYCANGTPDPHIVSGLYWRTHPQGRKWRSREGRQPRDRDAFYI